MSLLSKAKVITTPTAYSDGILHSVKPNVVLGDELVVNGDFSDGTNNWTPSYGSTLSVVGGQLKIADIGRSAQSIPTTIGTSYFLNATITNIDSSGIQVKISNNSNLDGAYYSSDFNSSTNPIVISHYFVAASSTTFIGTNQGSGSAYLDNVSVKEDISADFTFTRNSSATRVGEDGYIQDVQIIGSELVQNGNFEEIGSELVTNGSFDTDSNWTLGTGWTIANGKLTANNAVGYALQGGVFESGVSKTYRINLTISDYVSGYFTILTSGGTSQSQQFNANGNYTIYFNSNSPSGTTLHFTYFGSFTGSIDNVSVKEVGQNWEFVGEAEFTGSAARIYSSSGSNSYIAQGVLTNTKKYRLSYEITDSTQGSLKLITVNGVSSIPIPSFVGTHKLDFTANTGILYILRNSGATDVTIDNISVKEITEDTNLPRINYENGKGHLLLEGQSTNLITYSEDFSGWDFYQATSNTTTSPSGSTVYFLDFEDTRMFPSTSISSSTTYTSSIYLKANKVADVKLRNAKDQDTVITLTTDWVRYEVTAVSNSTSTNALLIDARFSQGLGASGLEIALWGAMIEEGNISSYIPTNGSAVTRSAETCTNAGNADLFDSTAGVLYAEIAALADSTAPIYISLSDGTTSNRVCILLQDVRVRPFINVSNVQQAGFSVSLGDNSVNHKIAFKFKENDFALWVNGVELGTDTSGITYNPNTLNTLNFDNGGGGNNFYGKVKMVAVFPYLSNDEMECLTGEGYGSFEAMALANNYTII